jgi:hypothetical protein
MAIGRMSLINEADRYLTIAVDSYDNWEIKGVIFQGESSHGTIFSGFTEMIMNMDHLFDSVGAPKQTFQMRCLSGSDPIDFKMQRMKRVDRMGKLKTIRICLRFRYHASWQGTMIWDDGNRTASFDSELQFIMITNAILQEDVCEGDKAIANILDPEFFENWSLSLSGDYMDISMTEGADILSGIHYGRLISSEASEEFIRTGQKASFTVKVMFREHNTWQGMIYWREGKVQQTFRSFKEMLYMISSVVKLTLAEGEPMAAGKS